MIYLGIDTSNYKTSIAAVDDEGRTVYNISEYLEVPRGDRGLRQSDAFFKHSNKLPAHFADLLKNINPDEIASIGVSDKPRRVEDSYMPCFLAGLNLARVLSGAYDVPLYCFSHQEGHAAAVIESDADNAVMPERSILMHLSGGTTEILKCSMHESGYAMDIIGGTLDISIGQLIDRFGVALGFPFPAGKYIDELASEYRGELPGIVPGIRVSDGYFNLSGPETVLMKYAEYYPEKTGIAEISADIDALHSEELSSVSYELIDRISDILLISSEILTKEYDIDTVYMAGGVASSSVLRKIIDGKHSDSKFKIKFGDPVLSGDNAVGTALLARRIHNNEK